MGCCGEATVMFINGEADCEVPNEMSGYQVIKKNNSNSDNNMKTIILMTLT